MNILPTFIVPVSISNEYFDDGASHATIIIDENRYAYIKKASRAVKKLKAYSVEFFDSPDEWNVLNDTDSYKDNKDLTLDDLKEHPEMRTDCDMLVVTEDHIYFDCSLKHVDGNACTESIKIKDIDTCFKLLKKPLEDMPTYIHDENFWIRYIATERLKHGT